MIYVWITLFILMIIIFWGLNFIGLPGNWMIGRPGIPLGFFQPPRFSISLGSACRLNGARPTG